MKKDLRKSPSVRQSNSSEKAARKKENTGFFLIPFLITVIALAVESFLVFNEKTGVFGTWFYNVLVGLFGIAAYFIPVGALVIAFFFNGLAENKTMLFKSIAFAVFTVFLSALNSLASVEGLSGLPVSIPDYFVRGYSGEGGGVVGGLLGKLLGIAFGNVFAMILSVAVCIVSITFFLGTTKAGAWYYLKELRMFGAEKTATPKAPKKAPEKISSKEEDKKPENVQNANNSFGRVGSVPTAFGGNKVNPFRFGTEVGRGGVKNTMAIDLRSPLKKEEAVKDIYSEENAEEKEAPDIKIQQPTVQFNQQNGRAYSPFADPFTKKEDFIKNGVRSEPEREETPHAPSRVYSPFNPLTRKEQFVGRDDSAEAEIKVAAKTAFADSGHTGGSSVRNPIFGNTGIPDFSSPALSSPNGTPQILYGQSGNALGQGVIGAQSGGIPSQSSAPRQNGQGTGDAFSGNTLPNNPAVEQTSRSSQGTANVNGNPSPSFVGQQGAGVSQGGGQTGSMATGNELSDLEKEKKNIAPWDIPVGRTLSNTDIGSNNTRFGSDNTVRDDLDSIDDEYTEDVEDEYENEEEEAPFVKRENVPAFGVGAFKNIGTESYGDEGRRGTQSTAEEEQEYRDRSEKLYPNYVYPSSVLLEQYPVQTTVTEEEVIEVRDKLLGKLASFKIDATLVGYSAGPTITRYEIEPGPGVTVKSITNRADDIALALQAEGIRIATVPGKSVIGVEVPNKNVSIVSLRSLIENRDFMESKSKITVCVGLTVTGKPVFMNIDSMPHVLIAGQTNSGKSVAINCMLLSLLYRTTPDEVQLILIDPKRVELNIYSKVPHLIMPVIDEPKRAAAALRWAVNEMERRYEIMDNLGVRNRKEYYELKEQDPSLEYLPQIIIVIDELADLMLQVKEHVESLINRIAAKARACGIHLLVGTQRPSVDVVTGIIKANIPARIAFQVATGNDSRTIFDTAGAEKLLGKGDMIYQATGSGKVRLQGAFVSSSEVKRVAKFITDNNGEVRFDPEIMRQLDAETERINKTGKKQSGFSTHDNEGSGSGFGLTFDYENICRAMEYVLQSGITSKNNIQRYLHVGYNKAADIVDQLEDLGFISPRNGSKAGEILVSYEDFMDWKMRNAP